MPPKGKKKVLHKGKMRHFTNVDDIEARAEKEKREKEWNARKDLPSSEESEGEEEGAKKEKKEKPATQGKEKEDDISFAGPSAPKGSSEESSSDEDQQDKHKGVEHLIEIENPNRIIQKTKKITSVDVDTKTELSRREREEIQKQQAKAHYDKLHMEGKTDEARADLARLALIKKQREDAARKKEEEKKERDATLASAEQKLRDKKKQEAGGDSTSTTGKKEKK